MIDLVIRIELTPTILLTTVFGIFFIIGNIFPESHGFVAVPVTRSNNFVSLHYIDRDKLDNVSLIHLVTGIATKPWLSGNMFPNTKSMRKLMIEFLRKFENRGIKIVQVYEILITKSINFQLYTLIFYGVGVCCDRRRFFVLSPWNREVCVTI